MQWSSAHGKTHTITKNESTQKPGRDATYQKCFSLTVMTITQKVLQRKLPARPVVPPSKYSYPKENPEQQRQPTAPPPKKMLVYARIPSMLSLFAFISINLSNLNAGVPWMWVSMAVAIESAASRAGRIASCQGAASASASSGSHLQKERIARQPTDAPRM